MTRLNLGGEACTLALVCLPEFHRHDIAQDPGVLGCRNVGADAVELAAKVTDDLEDKASA